MKIITLTLCTLCLLFFAACSSPTSVTQQNTSTKDKNNENLEALMKKASDGNDASAEDLLNMAWKTLEGEDVSLAVNASINVRTARGKLLLARFLSRGYGIAKNEPRAKEYFLDSYNLGSDEALFELFDWSFSRNIAIEDSIKELSEGRCKNNDEALARVAFFKYWTEKRFTRKWYEEKAELQGYVDKKTSGAIMYMAYDAFFNKDYLKAKTMFESIPEFNNDLYMNVYARSLRNCGLFEDGISATYRAAKKLNIDALKDMADYFIKNNQHEDAVRALGILYAYTRNLEFKDLAALYLKNINPKQTSDAMKLIKFHYYLSTSQNFPFFKNKSP